MKFDFNRLAQILDPVERFDFIKAEINNAPKDDVVFLSDCYANSDKAGGTVLEVLAEEEHNMLMRGNKPTTWKIKVICDEWANEPRPGGEVVRRIPINRKNRKDQPVRSSDINSSMVDGSYDDRFVDSRKFKIDSKGCIECSFTDAGYFISVYGVHPRTGYSLNRHRKTSEEPCECPNGQNLHVHYWRYKEMDKESYAALPELKPVKGPRRGIDPVEEIKR
jgi:hypothetical protein